MPMLRVVAAAILLLFAPGGAIAASSASAPVLEFEGADVGDWLDELTADRIWLERLPSGLLTLSDSDTGGVFPGWIGAAVVGRGDLSAYEAAPGREEAGGVVSAESLLRSRWLGRGCLGALVVRADGKGAAPDTFRVRPGPRYRVGEVRVEGQDFPARDRILERYLPREGDAFRPEDWRAASRRILAAAGDAGHPYARWVVREAVADSSRSQVDLSIALYTGRPAVIGPQTSSLPNGRGEGFLLRAAGLRTGDPFRETELRAARERLLQRDVYAAVADPLIYSTAAAGTVGVHWPVTPIPHPSRLAVVLGLSRAAADQPSRLSGQVDLQLVNLAGTGRRLDLAWSDDGKDRSHFGFLWGEPLAFGTPLDADFSVDHEVLEETYTRFRTDVVLDLPVVGRWGVEIGAGWDRSTYPAGDYLRSSRIRTRAGFRHRRAGRATSGWEGVFAIESARRWADLREQQDAGAALESEDRQTLLEVSLAGEQWIGPALSLAGRGSFRDVSGEGVDIPLSEQYRFGGARTVRGYLEQQFHGERVTWGGIELRIGRPGGSRLYTFFDMGYFRFAAAGDGDSGGGDRSDTVRGYGIGIETRAAGGDVSLAIGLPDGVDFDRAKLHVSLLQAF